MRSYPLSFGSRFTLYFTGTLAATALVVSGVLSTLANRQSEQQAERAVGMAGAVMSRLVKTRADALAVQCDFVIKQAGVGQLITVTDPKTCTDFLADLGKTLKVDAAVLLGPQGRVIGGSEQPSQDSLDHVRTMTRSHWSGIIVADGRPRLLVISAVRDPQSQELQGCLLVYRNLDNQLAAELAETLQGKITFLLDGSPIASATVGDSPLGNSPEIRSRTSLPDDATGGRLTLELGLSRAALLNDFERGRLVVAGVFLISCLLGVLLTIRLARRFTKPLEAVIAAAQRVRAGDWPEPLTVCGQPELGMLQEVFNEMTVSLRIHQLVTVQTLAAAVDARDTYTRGHSDRVAEYARQLAVALGFSEEQVERIHTIGTLHDVGKIGIPDSVLLKPGPLDPEERKIMESHAVRSEELIRNVPSLVSTLPGIRHHHERWDGKGYPDGLVGEAIPLDARVLALADTFDALTSDRPYRKGWDFDRALAEIERCAGTQFDPALVPTFLSLWGGHSESKATLSELPKAA